MLSQGNRAEIDDSSLFCRTNVRARERNERDLYCFENWAAPRKR